MTAGSDRKIPLWIDIYPVGPYFQLRVYFIPGLGHILHFTLLHIIIPSNFYTQFWVRGDCSGVTIGAPLIVCWDYWPFSDGFNTDIFTNFMPSLFT